MTSLRVRADQPELLDGPVADSAELRQNLADIRAANRWLGGTSLTMRAIDHLVAGLDSATFLDVATGSADIPRVLVQRASQRGVALRAVGSDVREDIIAEARRYLASIAEPRRRHARTGSTTTDAGAVSLVVADGLSLPFVDGAFDVVGCSLVIHHLEHDVAVALLREMRRVARRGVLVNDLVRTWPALIGAWLWSRLATSNRLTRHDAPLSVRRAYTATDLRDLMIAAGLREPTASSWLGTRVVLAARVDR